MKSDEELDQKSISSNVFRSQESFVFMWMMVVGLVQCYLVGQLSNESSYTSCLFFGPSVSCGVLQFPYLHRVYVQWRKLTMTHYDSTLF